MRSKTLLELIKKSDGKIPFTYTQAEAICQCAQNLVGKALNGDYNQVSPISAVVIAPFSVDEKRQFIDAYMDEVATPLDGSAYTFYDVLLIAHLLPERVVMVYIDIRSYYEQQQKAFNPDDFASSNGYY